MSDKEIIETEGEVMETMKNALFRVRLDSGHEIICHPSGKIRKNNISILQGDRVKIAMSPYDLTKGRITFRLK
jgi:translation initiation factor IF-1